METIQFYPIDVSYKIINDKAEIYIYGKTEDDKKICVIDTKFNPYFLVELKDNKQIKQVKEDFLHLSIDEVKIIKTQIIKKNILGKEKEIIKVFTQLPSQVPVASKFISDIELVKCTYETDIKFGLRYLIDKKITPLILTEVKGTFVNNKFIADSLLQNSDKSLTSLKVLGFDIETYSPSGVIYVPEKNPIIMLSLYGKNFKKVLTWKKFSSDLDYIEHLSSEKELLIKFKEYIKEYNPDVLVGYNSDSFDLPYIETRAKLLDIKLDIGQDDNLLKVKNGEARIMSLPHIDIFKFIRRVMSRALKISFYTLDNVAEELLGEKKVDVNINKLAESWDKNINLEIFAKYNLKDSELAHNLFEKVFPNMLELIKIVNLPIYTLSRATHSQFVESYILNQTTDYNEIILNRPSFHEKERRYSTRYQGAFVYQPTAGLYQDLIVLDFRSFYPSLIVSHNIGPSSVGCNCCKRTKNKIKIDNETIYFCEEKKGFLPSVLEKIIEARAKVKIQLKTDKKNLLLNARSQALKDLSNAFYGYLGFSSARWYNYNCAQAITALARNYIKNTIEEAQKNGFEVIYGDTDSVFLSLGKKEISDINTFIKKINGDLPGCMELELQDHYPAGIFVSTKTSTTGAKKRYALIEKDGNLIVKGFESVRRNISPIAKEVQEKVLKIILGEQKPQKAITYLKDVIENLKLNQIDISKLVITTLLQKPIKEYNSILPHVAVAKEMEERGIEVHSGSIIKFVIVKGKGKISQRAKLPQLTKIEDCDFEYYIKNQIIPSVDKIFEALGYSLEELITEKNQSTLQGFFK